MALRFNPTGGIYFVGSVTYVLREHIIQGTTFMNAFNDKARLGDKMSKY
jgi:glucokinase